MARCSPLGKVGANAMDKESIDKATVVAQLEHVFGENSTASDGVAEYTLSEGVSDNVNSKMYYFGSSTIMLREMVVQSLASRSRTNGHRDG
jgi:hypothetical protein